MAAQLNHTIVWCSDNDASSRHLTKILGLDDPKPWGPFMVVELGNGVSLDYHGVEHPARDIASQHYAFMVGDDAFDEVFRRIREAGDYWADPALTARGRINHNDGGRGVYFHDPDGHLLEVITRPYGSSGVGAGDGT